MDLGFLVDSTLGVALSGDALSAADALQEGVHLALVAFSVVICTGGVIPGPLLLGREALTLEPPHGQQGVAVGVPWWAVDGEVAGHPFLDVRGQVLPTPGGPLGLRNLHGNSELDLTGKLRIASFLGGLDPVPQGASISRPSGGSGRQEDLAVSDGSLALEVPRLAGALIGELAPGPVGCGGHNGSSGLALGTADDPGVVVVERHARVLSGVAVL